MYLRATRLANLVLTKAVLQLFHQQVHNPRMQPRGDIFFQIKLSGALLLVLIETV